MKKHSYMNKCNLFLTILCCLNIANLCFVQFNFIVYNVIIEFFFFFYIKVISLTQYHALFSLKKIFRSGFSNFCPIPPQRSSIIGLIILFAVALLLLLRLLSRSSFRRTFLGYHMRMLVLEVKVKIFLQSLQSR